VLPDDSHDAVRQARTDLTVWEQLTERISAGWPRDGWHPIDFYRDDLTTRDQLETALTRYRPPRPGGSNGLPAASTKSPRRSPTRQQHHRHKAATHGGGNVSRQTGLI
jgi:hypothetical protein